MKHSNATMILSIGLGYGFLFGNIVLMLSCGGLLWLELTTKGQWGGN